MINILISDKTKSFSYRCCGLCCFFFLYKTEHIKGKGKALSESLGFGMHVDETVECDLASTSGLRRRSFEWLGRSALPLAWRDFSLDNLMCMHRIHVAKQNQNWCCNNIRGRWRRYATIHTTTPTLLFSQTHKKKLHVIILDYYTAFVEDSLALANHMHDTVTVWTAHREYTIWTRKLLDMCVSGCHWQLVSSECVAFKLRLEDL